MGRLSVALMFPFLIAGCGPESSQGGGEAEPIARAFVSAPEGWDPWHSGFSPDGELLAFFGFDAEYQPRIGLVAGGELIATTKRSVAPSDFAWMPDSESVLVAYGRPSAPSKLGIFDLDGELVRDVPLAKSFRAELTGMAVSPDGSFAVVSAMQAGGEEHPAELLEVDLRTGSVRNVTDTPTVSEEWPVFVRADELILTARTIARGSSDPNGWVAALSLATGTQRRLTSPGLVVDSATARFGGDDAIFNIGLFGQEKGLWSVPLDGGAPERVISVDRVRWPTLTPDGKGLLVKVVGSPTRPGGYEIYRLSE